MPLYRLGRTGEVPPGRTKYCVVEGRPVLLANCEGRIYALGGICPHRSNPLDGAVLWGHLLDCPWHHFQYDVRTGENYFPKNVYPEDLPALQRQLEPLPTYRVELRGSEIWVQLE
jgi:3-phenylpropionate/trans-cinnamate dioxygenase ferredoxin component